MNTLIYLENYITEGMCSDKDYPSDDGFRCGNGIGCYECDTGELDGDGYGDGEHYGDGTGDGTSLDGFCINNFDKVSFFLYKL